MTRAWPAPGEARTDGRFAGRCHARRRSQPRTGYSAIRLAIGSSRWHILRQLLTEAVLVSLAGGIAGTAFATVLLRLLMRWQPFRAFPVDVTVGPDIRVYGLAFAAFARQRHSFRAAART